MKKALLGSTALVAGLILARPLYAQDAPTAAPPPADEGLTVVVVTAQRRTENVQKTPIAVTAISGDDIRKHGENQLDTTLRNVPSLQIQGTPQGGAIYIRGVGSNGDSNFIDPSVSLSMDDVYSGRSERLSAGLYDINHIEVLRGPQGTLYGRNADAGSANVITADPVINRHETRLNFQLGNYDLRHFDFAENIPVNDQFALRIAGEQEDRDGYFSNGGYSSHVSAGRIKALWKPNDDLTVHALIDHSHQTGLLTTSVPVAGALPPGPFPAGGWDTDASNPWFVDAIHPADTINFLFTTAAVRIDYRMPWATLTVIPAYTHSRRYFDTNLVVGTLFGPLTPSTTIENQKTLEVRLASPDTSAIKWIAGYYYLWSDNAQPAGAVTAQNGNLSDGSNITLFNSITAKAPATTSMAPFGQVTIPLNDKLRFTAGVRYTQDSKSQAVQVQSVYVPGYDSGVLVDSLKNNATTWKVDLEYDLAPRSMIYGLIAKGYKAGGYATTAVPPVAYQPETVTDYEIGSKNRFFGNKLQVNASIYYYQYHDIQVQYALSANAPLPIPDAYIPSGATYGYFQQYIANGGAGINKGAEIETRWLMTPDDELEVNATYTEAHYGQFAQADLAGLSGESMAATPMRTVMVNYAHSWNFGEARLTAQIDTKLSSSYWASVNNRATRPESFQKSYSRSDASLVYDSGKTWTLSVWVKNIEDEAQIQFGDFPLNRNVINFPRTYGSNLSLKF